MRPSRVIDALQLSGSIRSTRGGLLVNDTRVPLEDVAVLLLGARATISGGALTMLAKYNVVVLNCDWKATPDLVGYSWSSNSRVAARHRAQAELSQGRRNRAWRAIVRAKIQGQANNLLSIDSAVAARLGVLRTEVKPGDVTNCEAQAARAYWSAYLGEYFRRVPGAADADNALLNYGYTVLRGFVVQAICAAGLWPTYSVWHRNRSNAFVLADDLIEPFRPAVDYTVYRLGTGASLDNPNVKRELVDVAAMKMGQRDATVGTLLHELAASFAMYVEGDRDVLDVPVWSPVSDPARL